MIVTTSSGDRQVISRLIERITYVANPVDADYQSMYVKVPIKVDGKAVDAANAPILFANSVGGALSALLGAADAEVGLMNPMPFIAQAALRTGTDSPWTSTGTIRTRLVSPNAPNSSARCAAACSLSAAGSRVFGDDLSMGA